MDKEKKIPRDIDDLNKILSEVLSKTKRFNRDYDNGEINYYPEIALKIRMLLHDTRMQTSLFKQLKIKEKVQYLDTAGEFDGMNLLTTSNLIMMQMTVRRVKGRNIPETQYVPSMKRKGRLLCFDEWWESIVICDEKRRKISRKDLILEVANRDKGAHVDGLGEPYNDLSKNNSLGWEFGEKGQDFQPMGNPIPSCIRQISEELIVSLEKSCIIPAG